MNDPAPVQDQLPMNPPLRQKKQAAGITNVNEWGTRMKRNSGLLAAGAAAATAVAMTLTALPADAFQQDWSGSASYRASKDFVPTNTSVHPKGRACAGGSATKFYVSLVTTSGNRQFWSSRSPAANGAWADMFANVPVTPGNALYLRWRGQNSTELTGFSAPCQGVFAI
jgi:hypothetical protein